jgi:hypothetical protein
VTSASDKHKMISSVQSVLQAVVTGRQPRVSDLHWIAGVLFRKRAKAHRLVQVEMSEKQSAFQHVILGNVAANEKPGKF